MKTFKHLSDLQSIVYTGPVASLQNESRNIVEQNIYTPRQKELYERLLFGLKIYEPAELYKMNSSKKQRIVKSHKKAQRILNIMKQEALIEISNNVINKFMVKDNKIKPSKNPNARLTASLAYLLLTDQTPVDPSFTCNMSFKDLGITKKKIINRFISEKLLPSDYNLLV
jgi:hypothetical protein